jgi:c-di-GMP-binding flagellar brake protein YcgR
MSDGLKFTINSKVEISWNDSYYKSNIEDVTTDETIAISIPIRDGQYVPLRKGEQVEVLYYYDKDIYKFYTTVVDRKVDGIPVILLAYPTEVFKVQRRRFVRIPIVCIIEYAKLEESLKYKALKAVMVDLSGGGMRVKLSEQVNLGDKLKAAIPIGADLLEVKGEVVRIEKDADDKRNICGISFVDLEDRVREKIIRHIFQKMREQMRKGY